MKTMHYRKVLTAPLALLLAAALVLAGCQGTATAPPDPVSQPPAEESSGAAPESSSQADEPAEPEPSGSEPPAESSSQVEEPPAESGSALEPAPESQSAAGEGGRYMDGLDMTDPDNHPEIPTPVWPNEATKKNNPRPRISLDGIYDRAGRQYEAGCVAPDDVNNPYHFDFRAYDFFTGIPEGGWVDEHGYVIHPNGAVYWSTASNLPITHNGEEPGSEPDAAASGSQTTKAQGEKKIVCSEAAKARLKKYGYEPFWGYESTDDGQWIEYEDEWGDYVQKKGDRIYIDMVPRILMLEFLGDFEDEETVLSWTEHDIQSAANKARSRYGVSEGALRGLVTYAHWLQEKFGKQSSGGQVARGQTPGVSSGQNGGTGNGGEQRQVPEWTPPTQEEIEEQERLAEEWRKKVLEEAKQRAAEQEAERQRKRREEYEREHAEEIAAREEYERATKAADDERLQREAEEERKRQEEQAYYEKLQEEYAKEVKEREEAALQQEAEETP